MSERVTAEPSPLAERLHSPAMARIILLIAICLTAAAWYVSRQAVQNNAEQRFEFRTQELEGAIEDRMLVYEQLLWGGVGLFNASENVSRQEWLEYVAAINVTEQWPGIQGMGYAIPIAADELNEHIAQVRSEGFPDYAIQPPEPRDEYTSIVYLEPFDERNMRAFGFDMWSNDLRRSAMTRARDEGVAATSRAITLVQETDDDVQRGFLTYVPVYETTKPPGSVEARRAAFQGWVYAPFRMGNLMADIHGTEFAERDDVSYEVFDGSVMEEENLLFDSDELFTGANTTEEPDFQVTRSLNLQGAEWTIAYTSGPNFIGSNESRQPALIGVAGLLIDGLLFFVITSLGITHRKGNEARAELQERSDELEEYTQQLEDSNTELAQFAYVASHDLQEPLRNLGSYSNLLVDRYQNELGEEGERWLGYISDSSNRMSTLLKDLLSYASVGTDIESTEPVNLDTVLDGVLFDMNETIEQAEVEIFRDNLPIVEGEEGRLQQLVQNLVGNAIKYRADGVDHKVWISLSETAEDWRVSIRDNGIGIKPEYHERVFEIFRRVGPRSKYSGTGIGLAVCRKVVNSHGGAIGVNSAPGEGSVFWFTLPKSAAPSVNLAESEDPKLTSRRSRLQKSGV